MPISTRLTVMLVLGLVVLIAAPSHAHAAVACGKANKAGQSVCYVDRAITPSALCNDGTAPMFWIRPGSGNGINTWVIWLEGGGHCVDQPSCAQRAASPIDKFNITSNGFKPSAGTGVLSSDPSISTYFYNANIVFVHYCSSDDWSGAHVAAGAFNTANPASWNFEGRAIALAAVRSLSELPYHFTNATEILLGGTSAGGMGITLDANDILPLLPPAPEVLLANDAGFSLDIGQFDPNAPAPYISSAQPNAFVLNFEAALALWQGRGDVKCASQAVTELEQVTCYNSIFLLQNNYIPLPTFVAESQIDTAQTTDELCPTLYGKCQVPTNPASAEGQYVTLFGETMAVALDGAGTPAAYSLTSPDAYMHVILTDASEFTQPYGTIYGNITPQTVWNTWLANPRGPRVINFGNAPGVSAPAQ